MTTKHRRKRQNDPVPLPAAFHRQAVETAALMQVLFVAYRREYEAGWPPGGAGLGVTAGPSDATIAALDSPESITARLACERATKAMRQAHRLIRDAALDLTTGEFQPDRPARDAVVGRREFDQALHLQRERDLRQV